MAVAEHLSGSDFAEGAEAYIRYCSGIAIVQFPEDTIGLHNRENVEEYAPEILGTAESLMMSGIKRIIRVSYSGAHKALPEIYHNFEKTEPAMREIVEYACERHDQRLGELNEWFSTLRPAPFLNPTLFRSFCHGKRIPTLELIDGFVPDARFMDSIGERAVSTAVAV